MGFDYDLLITGGLLVSSAGRVRADVAVRDGKIAALGCPLPGSAAAVKRADGLALLPGLIDAHVHFRDPGLTYKEDLATGSRSALWGGMTYVVDMPNVKPVTATAALLRERQALAAEKAVLPVGFFALLTADNLAQMEPMRAAGAVGFKVYLGSSVGAIVAPPDGVLLEQFAEAARLGVRVGLHAENNGINDWFTQKEQRAPGPAPGALRRARPDFSELEAVAKAIAYAAETGAKIHIYHVSSGKTVALLRRARAAGVDVTAETCPHYLFLDEGDEPRLGAKMKVYPTIKTRWDRQQLWQGVQDGTIEMIATDHAPHTAQEKEQGLWQAAAGAAGVEIAARLMLTAVNEGRLTLEQLAALMSENPARIWGLAGRGCIRVGAPANLTAVDLQRRGPICNAALHGKTNQTLFDGFETTGAPAFSVIEGKLGPDLV